MLASASFPQSTVIIPNPEYFLELLIKGYTTARHLVLSAVSRHWKDLLQVSHNMNLQTVYPRSRLETAVSCHGLRSTIHFDQHQSTSAGWFG